MRRKLSLLAPVFLLLVHATESRAQNAQHVVPITVTIPATNHAITEITFPGYGAFQRPGERKQFKVGDGTYADTTKRFFLTVDYKVGNAPEDQFSETFSFDTEALCQEEDSKGQPITEGILARVSCSVVERGAKGGVVCSALYSMMMEWKAVPDTCTGTVACLKCGEVKVCGSNPRC